MFDSLLRERKAQREREGESIGVSRESLDNRQSTCPPHPPLPTFSHEGDIIDHFLQKRFKSFSFLGGSRGGEEGRGARWQKRREKRPASVDRTSPEVTWDHQIVSEPSQHQNALDYQENPLSNHSHCPRPLHEGC
jgi:hypothetical protein